MPLRPLHHGLLRHVSAQGDLTSAQRPDSVIWTLVRSAFVMERVLWLSRVGLLVENVIRIASNLSSAVGMAVQVVLCLDVMLRQEWKNRLPIVRSRSAGGISFTSLSRIQRRSIVVRLARFLRLFRTFVPTIILILG